MKPATIMARARPVPRPNEGKCSMLETPDFAGLASGWRFGLGSAGGDYRHRQQADHAEDDLHPDEAAQDVAGGDPGLREQRDVRLEAIAGAEQQQADGEVGDGAGEHQEAGVGFLCVGVLRGGGEGHEAADGEKKERAQTKTNVGCCDGACDFANEHGGAHRQPQRYAAGGAAIFDDGEDHGDDEQKQERDVNAQIDIHEPADGDGRTQHGSIVGPAVLRGRRG